MGIYGHLLKEIRTSRGMSQKELAANIISQSALSRIENGADIPSTFLVPLLEKLNIHPTEFLMLAEHNSFVKSQDALIKLHSAYYSYPDMKDTVYKQRKLYAEGYNKIHLIFAISTELVYNHIHNLDNQYLESDIEILKNYLLTMDQWFLQDIILYIDVLFAFDTIFIRNQHSRLLRSLSQLPFGNTQREYLKLSYIHNVTVLSFERHTYNDLPLYLSTFESCLNTDSRTLTTKIYYLAYTNLFKLTIQFDKKEYLQLLDTIRIFDNFGYHQDYQDMLVLINKILKI